MNPRGLVESKAVYATEKTYILQTCHPFQTLVEGTSFLSAVPFCQIQFGITRFLNIHPPWNFSDFFQICMESAQVKIVLWIFMLRVFRSQVVRKFRWVWLTSQAGQFQEGRRSISSISISFRLHCNMLKEQRKIYRKESSSFNFNKTHGWIMDEPL